MRITPSGPVRLTLAAFVIALMCAGSAGAATENILHTFDPYSRGQNPSQGLLADAAGNLYGTTQNGGAYQAGTVFKLTPNSRRGWTEHVLYNFTYGAEGGAPQSRLISDRVGNLYGMTSRGGAGLCGVVYKLTPGGNSWPITVLYSFTGGADGCSPRGSLVFDGKGNLYGTAALGGDLIDAGCYNQGCGTAFELVPSDGSWTFSVLHTFKGDGYSDASGPNGGLIFDHAGNLYGTSVEGGAPCDFGCGTVFKLTPSGSSWTESIIYTFTGGADGGNPFGPLIFDQAGNLYGTTLEGGSMACSSWYLNPGCGTVFKLTHGGGKWMESVLYAFTGGTDSANPQGRLIFDQVGNLYGTAPAVGNLFGTAPCGTVFQLTPSSSGWTQSVLHTFNGASDGCGPDNLTLAASGSMFGTAPQSGPSTNGVVFELVPASGSWKESTVSAFAGADGGNPEGGPILDSTGSLYGSTFYGGSANLGAVYKLTPNSQGSWTQSLLYSFPNFAGGEYPESTLVFDQQGNLYGTTSQGGLNSCSEASGCGVVFELTPSGTSWKESIIHAFSGTDGSDPQGNLVSDAAGNLYGATLEGGTYGAGTVFQLAPSVGGTWTETVLYSFTGGVDGDWPGGIVFDQAGNLYGAAFFGGAYGYGAVFKLTPSSGGKWTETVLYSFGNGPDGRSPFGPLAIDAAGNLYGATDGPAFETGPGTVFQLSPSGALNVILNLTDGDTLGPVILDAAGNLYGTTGPRSSTTKGTVFQLSPGSGGWTETVLYTFGGSGDGSTTMGALARDASGNLYGNTWDGGTASAGVVYQIVP